MALLEGAGAHYQPVRTSCQGNAAGLATVRPSSSYARRSSLYPVQRRGCPRGSFRHFPRPPSARGPPLPPTASSTPLHRAYLAIQWGRDADRSVLTVDRGEMWGTVEHSGG